MSQNIFVHAPNVPDQKMGPFAEAVVRQMLMAGQLTWDQLAWKEGLSEWVPLRNLIQNQCPQCSNPMMAGTRFCPKCGTAAQGIPAPNQSDAANLVYPRNPPLSVHLCWLNIVLSGTAQIIYGQVGKGIFLAVLSLVVFFFSFGIGSFLICFISLSDAYRVGQVLKSGKPVGKWAWWPN